MAVLVSTLTLTAALPLKGKQREFDYGRSSKPMIFSNEENLSSIECGKVNASEGLKHFPWDVKVKIDNQLCAGVFISRKAVLTSKSSAEIL